MNKLVAVILVVTMLLASAAPALAHSPKPHKDYEVDVFVYYVPFYGYGYYNHYADYDCPFWGDFDGPVNHFDCFD